MSPGIADPADSDPDIDWEEMERSGRLTVCPVCSLPTPQRDVGVLSSHFIDCPRYDGLPLHTTEDWR